MNSIMSVLRVGREFLAQFEHMIHNARKNKDFFVSLRENTTFSQPLPPFNVGKSVKVERIADVDRSIK